MLFCGVYVGAYLDGFELENAGVAGRFVDRVNYGNRFADAGVEVVVDVLAILLPDCTDYVLASAVAFGAKIEACALAGNAGDAFCFHMVYFWC